jgi:CubicO group peptidase (beta-lactamase class C family)
MRLTWIGIAAFALVMAAPAAEVDFAKAGMDRARIERIKPRMQQFADANYVAGTVTLVMRRGEMVHLEAAGWQDIEAKKPMRTDTIFQLMSMTKPVTGVAVMMMVEEGKLRLSDPVEKHLPEFRGQMMVESKEDGKVVLRKPARPITIRDLMTHTSGMIGGPPPGIAELLRKMDRTLAEAVAIYAQSPLEFEPGSKWLYSNTGLATLGRLVEVASGMPYERFLDERIFKPLGMVDSHIYLPKEKRGRLAPVYAVKEDKLVKAGGGLLAGDPMNYREGAKYSGPEYALHSTAADLAKFYQMMLNGGTLGQTRILSPVSVEIMTKVHTGEIRAGWLKGTGFGLTWEVVDDPIGTLSGMAEGCFSHGGAFGTFGWVDPARELVGVFLVQHSGSTFDARDAFIGMANTSIVSTRR